MKKILHVTKGQVGGIDYITKDIIEYYSADFDHEVVYFYPEGKNIYKETNNSYLKTVKLKNEILYVDFFRLFIKMRSADIVHIHHTKLWLLFSPAIFFSKKIVYTFHLNFGALCRKSFIEKVLISLIVTYCTIFSKSIVFLTKGQKNHLLKYTVFKKTLEHKSQIIPNFISSDNVIFEKDHTSSSKNIIFIGRYTEIKGFSDLKKLFTLMPDYNFTIIGDNSDVGQLPANVANLGVVDNSEIIKYLDCNSIYILPSYTEVFPVSVLEAMARGLVILISNIPGIDEIVIDGENGYLFKPGDINDVISMLRQISDNDLLLQKISGNNLKRVRNYEKETVLLQYTKVYGK